MFTRISTAGFVVLLAVLAHSGLRATEQTMYDSTIAAIQNGEYETARGLIDRVKVSDSLDPDYFVLSVNYYYSKALGSVIVLQQGASTRADALTYGDSTGAVAGYLYDSTWVDLDTLRTGLEILRRGIELYPDRLDMRLGYVHTCAESELYEPMTYELIRLLERRQINNDSWLWERNKPLHEEPRSFVLQNVQGRVLMLWDRSTELTDSLLVKLASALCTFYPESVYGYGDLGAFYASHGQYDPALGWYQKAYAVDSTDVFIMANLAMVYEVSGDIKSAQSLLRRIIQVGAPEEQAQARQQLERLETRE